MTLQKRIAVLGSWLAIFLVAGGVMTAGQAPAPVSQIPTFKVQVDYVEVDVLVTDSAGNLVRDLKKDDFKVFEDGKAQTISTFSMVDIPVDRFERPLFASRPIEPDVKTNERPFDGRMYVIVIDDLHTHPMRTQRVRASARKFVEEHLGANDLVAVVHVGGARDAGQDFTNNKRLLLAAVDKTMGRKIDSPTLSKTDNYYMTQSTRQPGDPVDDMLDAERSFNARQSLDALRDISKYFADVHGRRKSILFFSEGIDYDLSDLWKDNGSGVSSSSGASSILDASRDAVAAATQGNVSIYSIDPRGLTDLGDESITVASFPDDPKLGIGTQSMQQELFMSQSGLRELSDQTGGFASVNRNDLSTSFDRIVRDNSTYYVLAYYPPNAKPGKVHSISVRVDRPGVTVRARKAYVTPKTDAQPRDASKNQSAAQKLITPQVQDAIGSPIPVSGLTLHVFASPFKGTAPNASVLIGIDLRGRDLRLAASDKVGVTYSVIDGLGKVRGGNTRVITMNLKPETMERAARDGIRLLERVDLPPGRYGLRVAAHDEGGGNVGSVLYDLEVPDFGKSPLSMSGITLTSKSTAGAPLAHMDEQMRGLMPGPPVAQRTFPSTDEIAVFAEVYDNEASKPHRVDLTATIRSDDGREMFKNEETRDSSELGGKNGGYGYAARIPLGDFTPGQYVLTISARSRLGEMPAAERQVQFMIGER